jgi:excinuclease ABC subunit C
VEQAAYRGMVDGLLLLLAGRNNELLARLRAEMDEAAMARRYEVAAQRRDQIQLLEKATVPQAVVTSDPRDTDVLGFAHHGAHAAIATLFVREGRVIGKETRIVERATGLDDAGLLEAWVTQYALTRTDLPRRVLVGAMPGNHAVLAAALGSRAGRAVELAAPARGRARRLVELAARNAGAALEQHAARAAGRRARHSEAVLGLQRELGLPAPPHRMICFDISNFGSDQAVAAVVASEDGRARKGLYRRMRMRNPGPDDFAMIGEAVERYWAHVESGELPRPDLVVIDGGAGQVGAARASLDKVATRPVSLIGLAKRQELVVREGLSDLKLARRSEALRALQRLRDEAHRFAIGTHRTRRGADITRSALDEVPGIGAARKRALLHHFGSARAVGAATLEDIKSVAGISDALAQKIHDHFRGGR